MKLLISVLIPLLIGSLGSVFTVKEIPGWYSALQKPNLVPPNWVFGPVWTSLFVLMGIAFYLIWVSKKKNKAHAYRLYFIQLVLNFAWSWLFFGFHSPALALVDIFLLWSTVLLSIIAFSKINKTAGYLLYPYLAWISFASYLNFGVWRLN